MNRRRLVIASTVVVVPGGLAYAVFRRREPRCFLASFQPEKTCI